MSAEKLKSQTNAIFAFIPINSIECDCNQYVYYQPIITYRH